MLNRTTLQAKKITFVVFCIGIFRTSFRPLHDFWHSNCLATCTSLGVDLCDEKLGVRSKSSGPFFIPISIAWIDLRFLRCVPQPEWPLCKNVGQFVRNRLCLCGSLDDLRLPDK